MLGDKSEGQSGDETAGPIHRGHAQILAEGPLQTEEDSLDATTIKESVAKAFEDNAELLTSMTNSCRAAFRESSQELVQLARTKARNGKDILAVLNIEACVIATTEPCHDGDSKNTDGAARPESWQPQVDRAPCPTWSGKLEELPTWKRETLEFFDIHRIQEDAHQLMILKGPKVAPPEFRSLLLAARTVSEFWVRLEANLTTGAVQAAICWNIFDVPVITKGTHEEIKRLHTDLVIHCQHLEDRNHSADLVAYMCVEWLLSRLGSGWLRDQYLLYERITLPPGQETRMRMIADYLLEKIGHLRQWPAKDKESGRNHKDSGWDHSDGNHHKGGKGSKGTETRGRENKTADHKGGDHSTKPATKTGDQTRGGADQSIFPGAPGLNQR